MLIFCVGFGLLALPVAYVIGAAQQSSPRPLALAILDFGDTRLGKLAPNLLAARLSSPTVVIVDRDLTRSAARGVGYQNSLNLSLAEARDLGAAIGCDFYILGDAQTLRRSSPTGSSYYESYASLFLVSARTGRLIFWQRPKFEAATPELAEQELREHLSGDGQQRRYQVSLMRAEEDEKLQRELVTTHNSPVVDDASEEESDAKGLRSPRPYRRLRPIYPDTAASADAVGTVDVLVELDKDGEVSHIDVARWAGFGLDEAALNTVKQLHFFPATKDGVPIPIQILLRYNFRNPIK